MTNPRRAIAIVRVSKEGGRGDDLRSPELQRARITEHCARHGLHVIEEIEAIDESGSQDRSSWWGRLAYAVERIEGGHADAIVAARFSRVARHRLRWAITVDRVERAGGTIESATEGMDTTTATGKFGRGMLAELNAFYADQMSESWKEVHANRLARGLPINGRPRFGYVYDAEEKMHRPDPVSGPVLAEAYMRYVSGESMYQLVGWIKDTGTSPVSYGIASKGLWSDTTLRRVLDSGFGAGLLNYHDPECRASHQNTGHCRRRVFVPGVHEPVIDAATWQAFRVARAERGRPAAARSERSPYLLSGMLRCMADVDGKPCDGRMVYVGGGARTLGPLLRCLNQQQRRLHTGGKAAASHVEADVVNWLHQLADDVEGAVARAAAEQADRGEELAALDVQLAAAKENRERQTRRFVRDLISEDVWPGIKAELDAAVATLEQRRKRLMAAETDVPAVIAAEALGDWPTLSVEHKRAALRRLIERVEVTPGRLQPIAGWANGGRRGLVRVVPR
jgi:DNA invertase Pin-like site-specific DNA recombinase